MEIVQITNIANTDQYFNRPIKYIAIHYTAGVQSNPGTAASVATNMFANPNQKASADFIVDDATIVQYNPDIRNRYTWAVGGEVWNPTTSVAATYYGICKNSNSISIEMCSSKTNTSSLSAFDDDWYFTPAVVNNTVQLTRYLMQEYKIPIENVITHHHVTGKVCPNPWCLNESRLDGWYGFKSKLVGASTSIDSVIKNDIYYMWQFFLQKGYTKYGTSAIIGNVQAESACLPQRVEGDTSVGYINSIGYTQRVDGKQISKSSFIDSEDGYGLCQWKHRTRKNNLYQRSVEKGYSIGDLRSQLEFIDYELTYSYKGLQETLKDPSSSIQKCSSDFLLNFFGSYADKSQANQNKRSLLAQQIYGKYNTTPQVAFNLAYTPISTQAITVDIKKVNTKNSLVDIALREASLGITEYPPNSNEVKYNDWFYGYHVSGEAYPWCLVFVQWCLNEAGITAFKVAGCTQFLVHYKQNSPESVIDRRNLQPGDIILFSRTSIDSAIADHAGIVVENHVAENGTYITVEGNTGRANDPTVQSNGGAVLKQIRYIDIDSLANGGGIMCGVRLQGANSSGGSTSTTPLSTITNWIKDEITDVKEWIQSLFQDGISSTASSAYKTGSSVSEKSSEYKEFTQEIEVRKTSISTVDIDANSIRSRGTSLLVTPTFVESPFIILKVGKYTFGSYSAGSFNKFNSTVKVTYPNYMTSIDIVKINGVVNQYTIQMVYQIQAGQDPNMIDKIFSSVGYGTVYISYGDWNAPAFIYKEEEAIITNLTSNVDFANSRITYTLKCTSNAIALLGGYYNFTSQENKPSSVINNMLYFQNSTYKLLDAFPGMKNQTLVRSKGLLLSDDSIVKIEAQSGMDALSYLNYLVSCMSDSADSPSGLRTSNYYLTICDDITGEFGGTYFKINKVSVDSNIIALDSSGIYEVDIGYPGDTLVTNFSINTNNSWALLYNYSQEILPETYTYNIDDKGNIVQISSPNILLSSNYNRVTETQRDWWTQMTKFPITATLEIKGLLRPALLMSKVRINALFYGQRHISSGIYVITKQEDKVDARGYRTILSLTRIAGDLDVIQTSIGKETVTIKKRVGGTTINDSGYSHYSGKF